MTAWRTAASVAMIILLAGLTSCRAHTQEASLTVFAASSLQGSFTEAASALEKARPGLKVSLNLAGSQQLRTQLEQGAQADVFASADDTQMDLARQAKLLAAAPRAFAGNSLVLVTPAANPGKILRLADLATPGKRLVFANASVPVGAYASAALKAMSGDSAYGADFEKRVRSNVVSEEQEVKSVLAKVLLGEADAGVVYATDVAPVSDKLRVIEIPQRFQPEISYPIAVLKGSAHPTEAAAFVDYLLSPEGQALLARHGFLAAK